MTTFVDHIPNRNAVRKDVMLAPLGVKSTIMTLAQVFVPSCKLLASDDVPEREPSR